MGWIRGSSEAMQAFLGQDSIFHLASYNPIPTRVSQQGTTMSPQVPSDQHHLDLCPLVLQMSEE